MSENKKARTEQPPQGVGAVKRPIDQIEQVDENDNDPSINDHQPLAIAAPSSSSSNSLALTPTDGSESGRVYELTTTIKILSEQLHNAQNEARHLAGLAASTQNTENISTEGQNTAYIAEIWNLLQNANSDAMEGIELTKLQEVFNDSLDADEKAAKQQELINDIKNQAELKRKSERDFQQNVLEQLKADQNADREFKMTTSLKQQDFDLMSKKIELEHQVSENAKKFSQTMEQRKLDDDVRVKEEIRADKKLTDFRLEAERERRAKEIEDQKNFERLQHENAMKLKAEDAREERDYRAYKDAYNDKLFERKEKLTDDRAERSSKEVKDRDALQRQYILQDRTATREYEEARADRTEKRDDRKYDNLMEIETRKLEAREKEARDILAAQQRHEIDMFKLKDQTEQANKRPSGKTTINSELLEDSLLTPKKKLKSSLSARAKKAKKK